MDDRVKKLIQEWDDASTDDQKWEAAGIDDDYLKGRITSERAIELYVALGMNKSLAIEHVAACDWYADYMLNAWLGV